MDAAVDLGADTAPYAVEDAFRLLYQLEPRGMPLPGVFFELDVTVRLDLIHHKLLAAISLHLRAVIRVVWHRAGLGYGKALDSYAVAYLDLFLFLFHIVYLSVVVLSLPEPAFFRIFGAVPFGLRCKDMDKILTQNTKWTKIQPSKTGF